MRKQEAHRLLGANTIPSKPILAGKSGEANKRLTSIPRERQGSPRFDVKVARESSLSPPLVLRMPATHHGLLKDLH